MSDLSQQGLENYVSVDLAIMEKKKKKNFPVEELDDSGFYLSPIIWTDAAWCCMVLQRNIGQEPTPQG
jgi:hypothetical protein